MLRSGWGWWRSCFATVNMVGGFVVTDRMLEMFKPQDLPTNGSERVNPTWVQLAYLAAAVCFILALKGLSSPKYARRGNWLGAIGATGVVVTLVADSIDSHGDDSVGHRSGDRDRCANLAHG